MHKYPYFYFFKAISSYILFQHVLWRFQSKLQEIFSLLSLSETLFRMFIAILYSSHFKFQASGTYHLLSIAYFTMFTLNLSKQWTLLHTRIVSSFLKIFSSSHLKTTLLRYFIRRKQWNSYFVLFLNCTICLMQIFIIMRLYMYV